MLSNARPLPPGMDYLKCEHDIHTFLYLGGYSMIARRR